MSTLPPSLGHCPFGTRPLNFNCHTEHGPAQALQKETHSVVIVSFPRRECARDPVHTLVKSVNRVGTSGLTEPLPVSRSVQAQLISGFGRRHCMNFCSTAGQQHCRIVRLVLVRLLLSTTRTRPFGRHMGQTLSWPSTSHTVKYEILYRIAVFLWPHRVQPPTLSSRSPAASPLLNSSVHPIY